MVLLRELLGETLRRRRRAQKRTLRDVSKQANVSLGYLSEIERGHKEPSSELLASVCGALQVRLSEVLAEVSREVAAHERGDEVVNQQGRPVAVLPLPREKEALEEAQRRRRHAPPPSPASIAGARTRHRRGEVTDSVVRAAA
ncbi:helix-turn-helix domain-containing protein [Glycomyces buryatensis]|uniref:Helix-turn-helix transcriptional regulator n=1 Tax=Glycomyces buryatensis TaxID=2570927 RepID=A0A4S8QJQ1_9ACTN|nr:helix-turn-helix transcriptional regulator [Glycomyces buryatensis]THV43512.1 helix-turn-helix transcriptional regulator [Glycomyces buryatensis]